MVVYTAKYVPSFQYVFIKWFIKFTISPCPWVLVQSVPSFSTPGRTATLRRQTAAVPLVSYDDQQLAMTTTSQGGSAGLQQQHPLTVGKYPAAGVCGGGVPDMPAPPRPFTDGQHHHHRGGDILTYRPDVITC